MIKWYVLYIAIILNWKMEQNYPMDKIVQMEVIIYVLKNVNITGFTHNLCVIQDIIICNVQWILRVILKIQQLDI